MADDNTATDPSVIKSLPDVYEPANKFNDWVRAVLTCYIVTLFFAYLAFASYYPPRLPGDLLGFLQCEESGKTHGVPLAGGGDGILVDVGGVGNKVIPGIAEERLPARGGAGEDQAWRTHESVNG